MDRDEDGASIDNTLKVPVTIYESSDPNEPAPIYEAHIDPADIDRLIESLTALRSENRFY